VTALGAAMLVPLAATTTASAAVTHVANPYVGSTPYLNPDYVAEVNAQAAADGGTTGATEAKVAQYQTAIWLDKIAAVTGDSTHLGLKAQLDKAAAQAAGSSTPVLFEAVVYDLPGRDCNALASNGEIPATAAGLTQYETQYIDPIATLLGNSAYSNLRISTIIEPDSLPNAVTNASKPTCATAAPFYESGITYTLNKLHAIPNVYTYLDIGHSGWLGWSSNMQPAANEIAKVAKATTAGVASVDGFVSNTANTTPTEEPFLPNSTLQVGGQPIDSATFYQWNPYFDEHSYDEAMHSAMVTAGFPSSVGMLIDTSRNGWGGSGRPTALNSSPTDVNSYVNANRVDKRYFRGDWCNVSGAGIGYRPTAQPYGSSDPVIAYVWIKPPGESDGGYPSGSHPHGDPHCDPAGTQTDGNGATYPTGSIPGYDIPAGDWFAVQFQQLVANSYPALGSTTGGDTIAPSVPTGLTVTGKTSSSVSLSWTASTDNVGVTGYDVYRGTAKVGTSTSTTYTDTGLTASTAYSYTVKAHDAAGNASAASSSVSATTSATSGDSTAPSVPAGLTVTGTTTSSVSLSWTASTDNVGVTGYNVYRGGSKVGSVTSGTTYTDSGLSASTAYSYTVAAYDAAGNTSAVSAAVTGTTKSSGGGAGCTATYSVSSDWGSGFNGAVTVTNNGTAATSSWKVTWTWAGNQTITNLWNGSYTQSGKAVTVNNAAYNNVIAAGGNTSFGFGANYSGTNTAPTLTCTAG